MHVPSDQAAARGRALRAVRAMLAQRVGTGTALAIMQADLILLTLRQGAHGAGTWTVPGGWLEPGERPQQGACRETLEEVGIRVDPSYVVPIGVTNESVDGVNSCCLWFKTEVFQGPEVIKEPDKIAAAGWFTLDTLLDRPDMPLFPPFEHVLRTRMLR